MKDDSGWFGKSPDRPPPGADPGRGQSSPVESLDLDGEEQRFAAWVGQQLEYGNDALDGATRSRLRQARARAIESRGSRRWLALPWPGGWRPAAGVLAASALALLAVPALMQRGPLPETAGVSASIGAVDDLEIVLNVENLEMIEDLEFFEWLTTQPEVI
jgi:hypothetical protein